MADTPEKRMKKKVDNLLNEYGCWYFAPQSGIYGNSGIPDRIGILPGGRAIAVEVKATPKHKPTALQSKVMRDMAAAGAVVWLVDSEQALVAMSAALTLMGYERYLK